MHLEKDDNVMLEWNQIMNKLFCFGLGFTGENIANYFIQHNWQVYGTIRKEKSLNPNITILKYDPQAKLTDLKDYLSETDILLISIAPDLSLIHI